MLQLQALYLSEENVLLHCGDLDDDEARRQHDVVKDHKKAAMKKRQVPASVRAGRERRPHVHFSDVRVSLCDTGGRAPCVNLVLQNKVKARSPAAPGDRWSGVVSAAGCLVLRCVCSNRVCRCSCGVYEEREAFQSLCAVRAPLC